MAPSPPAPPDQFFEAFSPRMIQLLVEALSTSSDNAAELHDENFGSNATTFGLNLYHFSTHEIAQRATESSGLVVVSRLPVFRACIGDRFELACYKVGNSAADDIWRSFPNNDCAAANMVQPYLPGFEPDISSARKVVLAYMANHEDGLCAAYLCVATRQEDNRIAEWGFTYEIFNRASMVATLRSAEQQHPPETVEDFELTRRRTRDEDDDTGE